MSRRTGGRRAPGTAALFLGPKALLFVAFVLVPFAYTFVLMFQRGTLMRGFTFVGLDNLTSMLQDSLFWLTLRNTGLYLLVSVPLNIVVPLAVALLISRRIRGMRVYRSLIYIPSLLSIAATGLIWNVLIDPDIGPLYQLTNGVLGLDLPYLSNGTAAIVLVAVVGTWSALGFNSIIFMAGLNDIPEELYEAASIDGAGRARMFWEITLPLLRPVMQILLVLVTIAGIQVFDMIYVMTQGGPGTSTYTVMWYIYQNVFAGGSVGYAAAMGVIVLIVSLVITGLYLRLTRTEGATYD
ncbi:binding-protein-dependent transport systems inner membrane component [Kribbella flavida DSM 17836]|uniref:Binding-protein-dependent transport systems inner membrane component n=1 Tax=Kribbella flavida (strain DSM 17836 / JCM 10339 / NBRC 14399) TaxID=479435 RepID=D2PWR8_KRIFD|nr:sugar ABC transporter permease [Kribbella flavida]ADB33537.1 binding-protein-dependent transport systems inner membrane component [Kribbella flavida DSM 17836]